MATTLTDFATVADLSARLGRDEPAGGSAAELQMEAALADASHELRAIIGQAINAGSSTVTQYVTHGGYLYLPAVPATTITSVVNTDDGSAVDDYTFVDSKTLRVPTLARRQVSVTYDHGWAKIPGELVKWTCVLAASSIAAAKAGNLGLSGGLSGIGVDDARASFATRVGEQGSGVVIPESVQVGLRARYGAISMGMEQR